MGFTLLLMIAILGALLYLVAPPNWHVPPATAKAMDTLVPRNISMQRLLSRPYLGVTYQEENTQVKDHSDIAAAEGSLVTSIAPSSPAAMAGLTTGDVDLALDGQTLGREQLNIEVVLGKR